MRQPKPSPNPDWTYLALLCPPGLLHLVRHSVRVHGESMASFHTDTD